MTERLPTYIIEAITDAATVMSRMVRECQYPVLREDARRVIEDLTQIIDGQAALKQPLPAGMLELPFAAGETS